jgi:hypothetical protein
MAGSEKSFQPFFFLITFWGKTYRDYFLDICLASLLAEGNIPALNKQRRSRILICTTDDDRRAIDQHPLMMRAREFVQVEFIEIPFPEPGLGKMLAMSKGHMLLSQAAFEAKAYGVFLTPDLMLSDGSCIALERLADAGRKVVLTVAIRFAYETLWPQLGEAGFVVPGEPLAVPPRKLMAMALQCLHTETLRYDFDSPWFADVPVSVYWRVPDKSGILIHSFSWAPLLVDYAHLAGHDTETFRDWTLDGDYIYRNFPDPRDIYVVTDSDEISLVSFTREADLHFELIPRIVRGPKKWQTFLKLDLLSALARGPIMDPLKRAIFPIPVRLHSADLTLQWAGTEGRVRALLTHAGLHRYAVRAAGRDTNSATSGVPAIYMGHSSYWSQYFSCLVTNCSIHGYRLSLRTFTALRICHRKIKFGINYAGQVVGFLHRHRKNGAYIARRIQVELGLLPPLAKPGHTVEKSDA